MITSRSLSSSKIKIEKKKKLKHKKKNRNVFFPFSDLQMSFVLRIRHSFSIIEHVKAKFSSFVRIDSNLKAKLERLSLLSFQNDQTVKKVEETIRSVDLIEQVEVKNLEPLYTLVENERCPLKQTDEIVKEKILSTKETLQNATNIYENYFVAPMIGKRDSQTVEKVDRTNL